MTARRWIRAGVEVVRAAAVLALIEVLLHSRDLPTTCRLLRIELDVTSAGAPGTATVVLPANTRVALRAADAALSRWPFGDTCLRRCLLVGHRLRALRPVLRIGVMRQEGTFGAHAWLEIGGATLDPEASQYAALGAVVG